MHAYLVQLEEAVAVASDQQTGDRVQVCAGQVCSALIEEVTICQLPRAACITAINSYHCRHPV